MAAPLLKPSPVKIQRNYYAYWACSSRGKCLVIIYIGFHWLHLANNYRKKMNKKKTGQIENRKEKTSIQKLGFLKI